MRLRKRLIVITFITLYFFTNPVICNWAFALWEIPAIKDSELPQKPCTAIVLGGLSFYDTELKRIQFSRSSDRLFQTLRIEKAGKISYLIISGGAASLLYPENRESDEIFEYMQQAGLSTDRVICENKSRNTEENARYSYQIIDSLKIGGPFILVTSAFHMRRALSCFKKYNLKLIPYSVDRYSGEMIITPQKLFVPEAGVLMSWDVLIHEIMGYIVYSLSGYY